MPIVTLSPSGDTHISVFEPNTNFASSVSLTVSDSLRTLVGFDLTAYAGAALNAAPVFRIRDQNGFEPATLEVHRILRPVLATQATWNSWSTGNAWATAGATGTGDRSAAPIATGSFGTGPGVRAFTLDQATIQAALGGVLWLSVSSAFTFVGFDSSESANPPTLELDYSTGAPPAGLRAVPQAGAGPTAAGPVGMFFPPIAAAAGPGILKTWTGSAWVEKPAKAWNGSAWATKPLRRFDGSTWV